jgi:hypothetical protein
MYALATVTEPQFGVAETGETELLFTLQVKIEGGFTDTVQARVPAHWSTNNQLASLRGQVVEALTAQDITLRETTIVLLGGPQ